MKRRLFFRLLTAARPTGDHVPDSELLRRFARDRDSAAFELILHRHADSVWTACRRILSDDADAEDAFQTTFLVLVRKAGSIRNSCVGGWLHRVAVNAALKQKASGRREPAVLEPLELQDHAGHSPDERAENTEVATTIHEELARLPERYRLPVVLCDLEGHTHAEAAAVLNWPIGSVSGRLSRAHALLRDRLARRGVAAPAILFAVCPLTANAIHTAAAFAAGSIPVAPSISILVQGVLATMRTAKLQMTAWLAASVGLVALAGVGTVSAWPRTGAPVAEIAKLQLPLETAAPEPVVPPEKPIEGDWLQKKSADLPTAFPDLKSPDIREANKFAANFPRLYGENAIKIEASDDTQRRLLKARLHQAAQGLDRYIFLLESTPESLPLTLPGQIREMDDMRAVTLELWSNGRGELIPRLEEFVILAKHWERRVRARVEAGTLPPYFLHVIQRHRLEVEAVLWKVLHPKPAAK